MLKYILRRLLQMIPTVLGVILITFILFNLVGGSPGAMTLGKNVSRQLLEEYDEARGFNKPLLAGRWSGTRAFDDETFAQHAGPWRHKEGIDYVPAGKMASSFIRFAPGTAYPVPLYFTLFKNTSYKWIVRYRMPAEGQAALRVGTDTETHEERALPPSDRWRTVELTFSTGEHPSEQSTSLQVEAGALELQSVRLQRQSRHFFDSQFVHYMGQILSLDLGVSNQTNQRVSDMILAGIWPSLTLTVPIFLVGLVVAISLSLVCAYFRDTWLDRFFVVLGVALMSINYLVWIILGQYLMAYKWGWFPVWGYESMAYLMLPVMIGIVSGLGSDLRFYRTVMLDEMYKEYVRTAFAKGVGRSGVLFRHVLKNAMITVTTNVVIAIPFLYTGSLLLESFFGIPGLGYLGINAINSSDVDVIRAIVLIGSVLYVLANLATDICYALVDPRVKLK